MGSHDPAQSTAACAWDTIRHWVERLVLSRGAERCKVGVGAEGESRAGNEG